MLGTVYLGKKYALKKWMLGVAILLIMPQVVQKTYSNYLSVERQHKIKHIKGDTNYV